MHDEIEEAKENSLRGIKYLSKVKITDDRGQSQEIEPCIIIALDSDKMPIVILNKTLKFRTLAQKNKLMQALDILLVDSIQEVLEKGASKEDEMEKELR